MPNEPYMILLVAAAVLVAFGFLAVLVKRYKRCPSNRILVIYGKVREGRSARCLHGGGAFVWPLIQDYEFLSLDPQDHLGPFVLRFSPDGPEHPEAGSIVRVTGHFDDARSSECVVAPGEPTQAVHPSVQELYCRAQFVVDSIEVIGFDESFPLG